MDDQRQTAARATIAARLATLVEELGRPEPALMAARAFLDRLDGAVEDVVTASDATARDGAAHQLAGSAETLGAMTLGGVAREVMRLAREDPTGGLPPTVATELRAEAAAAAAAMGAEVDALEAASDGA